MTTVSELAQDLATEHGEDYSDIEVKDQYNAWVIEVFDQVVTSGWFFTQNGEETLTLVDGQRDYSLPTTVSQVRAVEDRTNGRAVAYVPVENLIQRNHILSTSGDPLYWYINSLDASQAIKVSLYPIPNAAAVASIGTLYLHVAYRPSGLSASSTIPLPPEYIRVMRDGVRYRAYTSDNNPTLAQLAKQDYAEGLSLLNGRFNAPLAQGSSLPSKVKRRRVSQMPSDGDV